jgi:hypothetical protein
MVGPYIDYCLLAVLRLISSFPDVDFGFVAVVGSVGRRWYFAFVSDDQIQNC